MAASPRGKAPADHKSPKGTTSESIDAKLEREALLAGMPELKAPHRLRYRERARVQEILVLAVGSGLIEEDADGKQGIEIDIKKPEGRDRLKSLHDVCGEIDEFAHDIAVDPEAYEEWSIGKGEDVFFAILSIYSEAVGESNGS